MSALFTDQTTNFMSSLQQEHVVIPLKPTIVLQKKEDGSTKTLNETLLSRLRPYRSAATAATLVALTGGEPAPPKKDEGIYFLDPRYFLF